MYELSPGEVVVDVLKLCQEELIIYHPFVYMVSCSKCSTDFF